ncbi:MAK10-like protein [Tanacetum coccineum]
MPSQPIPLENDNNPLSLAYTTTTTVRYSAYGVVKLLVDVPYDNRIKFMAPLPRNRDENPIRTLGDYFKPSHEGYRNTIELPVGNNVVPLRSDTIRERTRLRLFQFSLHDQASNWLERLPARSITTCEDLTTHFLAQFFPPGKTAQLRSDVLMFQQHHGEYLSEAWTHYKKSLIMASTFGSNGPHDTQYCMEDLEQAFVEYASSRTDEDGGKWYTFMLEQKNLSDTYNPSWRIHPKIRWRQPQHSQNNFSNPPNRFQPNGSIPNRSFNNRPQRFNNQSNLKGLVSNFMASQDVRLSKFEADFKQQQSEMTNKIDTVLKAITDQIAGALPGDTVKNPKLSTSPVLSYRSYPNMDPQCSNHVQSLINAIIIHSEKQSDSYDEKAKENEEEEKDSPKNIYVNPSTPLDPSVAFITKKKNDDSSEGEPKEEGSTTTEGVGVEYFDIFPTRSELAYHKYLMCSLIPLIFLRNSIITEGKLDPRENSNRGVSNFTGRIKGMHVFLGNFTYIVDFMIVEDISSIIDPRLSQVVLGKPFVEMSNMTHNSPECVVRFTNGTDEVAYMMPHMIEQYNSLSDLEKEHPKPVYLRNEEDKRRGVELYLMRRSLEVLRKFHWMILGGRFNQLSHVSSPLLSKPGEY